MVQGDAYYIDLSIKNNGEPLDVGSVETVEFMLLNLQKLYPGDVSFDGEKFHFPVTQEETFQLPALCPMQIRVKFKSGNVVGSEVQKINVKYSLSKVVL